MPQIVKDQHHCKYCRHWLMSHVGPLPSWGLSECSVFRHESSAYWGTGQQFFSNFSINVAVHYGWQMVWSLSKIRKKKRGNKCDLAKFDNAIIDNHLLQAKCDPRLLAPFQLLYLSADVYIYGKSFIKCSSWTILFYLLQFRFHRLRAHYTPV